MGRHGGRAQGHFINHNLLVGNVFSSFSVAVNMGLYVDNECKTGVDIKNGILVFMRCR